MTEQQANLLKLLKEIDGICRKHDIEYVLAGGSAIGAVRHHGFIPWDDDSDIYMTRENWLKFIEVSKTDFPENRCLLAQELDHSYTNMFGRYCDTTAAVIHRHAIYSHEGAGEVVDVFILDPVPDDEKEYQKYVNNIVLYSELINSTSPMYGYRYYTSAGRYVRNWLLCKLIGRGRVLNRLEKKMFCYDIKDCSCYAMRWGGAPFRFPKEWFEKQRTCTYEGMESFIPYMNNAYLTWHYGDNWTSIPPHGERESHNTVSRHDMGSEEFRREYNVFVKSDKRRWYLEFLGMYRKAYYMRTARKRERVNMSMLMSKARLTALELEARLAAEGINPLELAMTHDFTRLADIYAEYTRFQLSRECIGREDFPGIRRFNSPCFVPVKDEELLAALYMYIYTNRTAQALRLIDIRKQQDNYEPQYFDIITHFMERFRYAVNCYDLGDYSNGYEAACELIKEYPDNPVVMKLLIRYIFYLGMGTHEYGRELIDRGVYLHRHDGEFMYYDVMCNHVVSDDGELVKHFERIREHTNNGIILLEIDENPVWIQHQKAISGECNNG